MALSVDELRVVSLDSAHLIATANRMAVLWWKGTVTVPQVNTACATVRDVVARHPRAAVVLTVLDDLVPMPDEPVRAAMAQLMREGVKGIHAVAIVGDGRIFHQAAVRSVVTGLRLIVRVPFLLEVFGTVDEACDWFAKVSPGPPVRAVARTARSKLFSA
jgi:hypothetical protein